MLQFNAELWADRFRKLIFVAKAYSLSHMRIKENSVFILEYFCENFTKAERTTDIIF